MSDRDDLMARIEALQGDFNDCNSERARWKKQAEALQAENARLREIALEYRDVLRRAYTGPDKHCGYYTAKDYRFKKQDVQSELERIRAALKETCE